ncbi:MAG: ROK family protein [Actinobacteria bacterium]|nr:ROK family protein [Actinomycetota bacterium]
MSVVLGVDVGGTKVAAGPVDQAGTQLAPPLVEASRTEDTATFLAGLELTLRRALDEFAGFSPKAVGLACAGTVDAQRGVVVGSPNLPLVDTPVAAMMEKALRLRVVLENDANAAVLAETVAGAAMGFRHVVMLTLGTGVGGGILLDGRVYHGARGGAGELGHMVVQKGGLVCACGGHGCLEMYASGPALIRYAAAWIGNSERDPGGVLGDLFTRGLLTGEAVAKLAHEGHPGATEAVRELGVWLGAGLVSVSNIFDPEIIVVGGGVSALGEALLAPARDQVRVSAMPPAREKVLVVPARLGNSAGLVGAALSVWGRPDWGAEGSVRA